jgi:transcriptional regulator with XRE-family HTH domain
MSGIGDRIAQLRKKAELSQTELANNINASREAIGKYERDEATPSVDTAKKIADYFDVTIDHLVNNDTKASYDKKTIKRLEAIELLDVEDKKHLYVLMDAFLRDAKTRKAYGNAS